MAATSHVVVVGHGMVGHRFVEALRSRDAEGRWRITVLAEERDAAYDRVGLTGYTEHWDRARLALPGNDYAGDPSVELRLDTRVVDIDRDARTVGTADGSRSRPPSLPGSPQRPTTVVVPPPAACALPSPRRSERTQWLPVSAT